MIANVEIWIVPGLSRQARATARAAIEALTTDCGCTGPSLPPERCRHRRVGRLERQAVGAEGRRHRRRPVLRRADRAWLAGSAPGTDVGRSTRRFPPLRLRRTSVRRQEHPSRRSASGLRPGDRDHSPGPDRFHERRVRDRADDRSAGATESRDPLLHRGRPCHAMFTRIIALAAMIGSSPPRRGHRDPLGRREFAQETC